VTARARLWVGSVVLVASSLGTRPDRVGRAEARVFRAVNNLPDGPPIPVWLAMQPGSFGAVPVVAAVAALSGRPALARRLWVSGLATWLLAKAVKKYTARPRPDQLLAGIRRRGSRQTGLGFVSGHAGVVTSLCASALPELSPPARAAAVATALGVGFGRMYTAAHLPLDVVGGAALGLAVEAAVEIAGPAIGVRIRVKEQTWPTSTPLSAQNTGV
jgi:membrane-associated phospholipid phosphatase